MSGILFKQALDLLRKRDGMKIALNANVVRP